MSSKPFTAPVDDTSVPMIDNAVAVGEDLEFQERWWRFERIIWSIFAVILLADLLGLLGRGWLARAEAHEPATAMDVKYERIQRSGTPSIVQIRFTPPTTQGEVHLFVSDSLVKELGQQRVVPQPEHSAIGNGGITYTFPVTGDPATIQLEMESSFPGVHSWTLQVPGHAALTRKTLVLP